MNRDSKRGLCAVAAMLTMLAGLAPQAVAQNQSGKGAAQAEDRYIRFKRPNLVVPDMDAALKFYVGRLGFKLAGMEESKVDPTGNFAYEAFNFDPAKAVRQATLHSSTEERAFAITEVKGLDPKAVIRTPSLTAMVLETKRFLALRKELIADGHTVTEWRDTSNKDGVGIFEMGVLDPGGHLIVLFQYVDGKTPRQ
ncbi:MAG: VOC family protein [Rhodospirillaceae bacterium]|nr:VOC family protein [Rhodospirillaceae bacterium]